MAEMVESRLWSSDKALIYRINGGNSDRLLEWGDIESNPGPPKGSKKANVDDIHDDSNVLQAIHSLHIEIAEIKSSVKDIASLNARVTQLADSVSLLTNEIKDLKVTNELLNEQSEERQTKICELEKKVEFMESESKQSNIIIHGLKMEDSDNRDVREKKVRTYFREVLELEADDIIIEKSYVMKNKRKSVLIKLNNMRQKSLIFEAAMKVRESSEVQVANDYSHSVRQKRKDLIPHMLSARKEGRKAGLRYDKLEIDGKMYTLDDLQSQH
ncbi:hypothetical protein SNE40_022415 [Patella caerulea]|uniref:Uncharacterized protein n=1 Tax=Patella caerulea TaxID=87958 RepID=A0AAN8G0B1_PATCE